MEFVELFLASGPAHFYHIFFWVLSFLKHRFNCFVHLAHLSYDQQNIIDLIWSYILLYIEQILYTIITSSSSGPLSLYLLPATLLSFYILNRSCISVFAACQSFLTVCTKDGSLLKQILSWKKSRLAKFLCYTLDAILIPFNWLKFVGLILYFSN